MYANLRLLAVCAIVGVSACASQVPVAETYPLSSQQKMQSAHHWDVLAEHVAKDMATWLPTSPASGRTLVIRSGGKGSDFSRGFEGFLITRLHELEFAIAAPNATPDNGYKIVHEAQVIHHKGGSFHLMPGTFTLLGGGVAVAKLASLSTGGIAATALAGGVAADVAAGYIASETNTEIIVTITAVDRDLVNFRRSFVFYINDADAQQYVNAGEEGKEVLLLIDAEKPNAVPDAWRAADQSCTERGHIKAMLRHNNPRKEKRELRFECVDY